MKTQSDIKPVDILLVEDNPGDILLTMEALKGLKVINKLYVAEDGVEAMEFLYRKGKYSKMPRPDIILLDLNMPRKDGREVLAEIKQDDSLKSIPVIILTTSKSEEDILTTYGLHANCYITKPLEFEQFFKVIQSIDNFWFTIVKLPQ